MFHPVLHKIVHIFDFINHILNHLTGKDVMVQNVVVAPFPPKFEAQWPQGTSAQLTVCSCSTHAAARHSYIPRDAASIAGHSAILSHGDKFPATAGLRRIDRAFSDAEVLKIIPISCFRSPQTTSGMLTPYSLVSRLVLKMPYSGCTL